MTGSVKSEDRLLPLAGDGAPSAPPKPRALVIKLALALALAATLVLGAARPLPMFFLLLEAFLTALGGLSVGTALGRREKVRLGAYSHWHEAAAFGLLGLVVHLALIALR